MFDDREDYSCVTEKKPVVFPPVTLYKYHNEVVEQNPKSVCFHLNPELYRDWISK
jgi:hypothetical protein